MDGMFGASSHEDENEWLSVSDLMAGLMVVFLFIAIVFIRPLAEQSLKIKEIASSWQENETELYEALLEEFSGDLPRWNAEIEKETLLIRFRSPDVLFDIGRATIRSEFSTILSDFFPRYVRVLSPFRESIDEIRIEGHTSSIWNENTSSEEAYILNMELSQKRTLAVLHNVFSITDIAEDRLWLQPLLTANGLSSSRPILMDNNLEDTKRSRRVEFRVRTTARTEIVRILAATQ